MFSRFHITNFSPRILNRYFEASAVQCQYYEDEWQEFRVYSMNGHQLLAIKRTLKPFYT